MWYRNVNPAVVKSIFLTMKKEEFIKEASQIKEELLKFEIQEENENYRKMLLNLLRF